MRASESQSAATDSDTIVILARPNTFFVSHFTDYHYIESLADCKMHAFLMRWP